MAGRLTRPVVLPRPGAACRTRFCLPSLDYCLIAAAPASFTTHAGMDAGVGSQRSMKASNVIFAVIRILLYTGCAVCG